MKNKWLKFNVSQQTYYPKTVNDIRNNKFDIIHNELFEQAKLLAIINEKDEEGNFIIKRSKNKTELEGPLTKIGDEYFEIDNYKFIEKNDYNDYYLSIPKLIIIERLIHKGKYKVSLKRYEIDLAPYWNYEYEAKLISRLDQSQSRYIENEYPFNEIIKYDYIHGKAIIENKVEMKKRKIDFKDIVKDDNIKIDYKY